VNAFKNNKEMIIRAAEKNPREMKRFTNNIILAKSIFNKPISNLIAVQALRFRPEWNKFLIFITDDENRKNFFSDFKQVDMNDEKSKMQFLKKYPTIAKQYASLLSDISDPLRIFLFTSGAAEKLVEIENMNDYRRALDTVDVKRVSSSLTLKYKILTEWDRKILGTRYFASLCDLASKDPEYNTFTKDEVYDNASIDAYNRTIAIPPIIEKLKELKYITENEDNRIALTPQGKENCGSEVVLDESI
jgi:hypothetical protein